MGAPAMKAFVQVGILSLCLLAGNPAVAADNTDVERLATCRDSWFEWKTQNPAQLERVIARFQTDFAPKGNDGSFVPKSSQTVLGLPVTQVFPQSVGMGVGFSVLVPADFNRAKATLEHSSGKTL